MASSIKKWPLALDSTLRLVALFLQYDEQTETSKARILTEALEAAKALDGSANNQSRNTHQE